MKRFFCAIPAIFLTLTLCGCAAFHTALESQLEPADTVVILPSASLPEFSDIDDTLLTGAASEMHYAIYPTDIPAAQYSAFTAAAANNDTAVLVAELSSTVYAEAMIETAEAYDLPLIFCGKRPSLSVMERYDNCWYVGFDPALAAELQAKIIVDACRKEIAVDQNGDFKLSSLVTGTGRAMALHTGSYAEQLLSIVELAGIHTAAAAEPVQAADSTALYTKLDELLLPQQRPIAEEETPASAYELLPPVTDTEILFCADTQSSAAVLQVLAALQQAAEAEVFANVATPAHKYFVACYGIDDAVEQAVKDDIVLGAVGKDTAASTQAILALCENLAKKEAITKNNDYHFEDGKYLMLEYRVITAFTEAAQ